MKQCVLVVSPKLPWLGYSPDGIILQGSLPVGCIEVKHPYAKKDMRPAEATSNDKQFFLEIDESKLTLIRSHVYYYKSLRVFVNIC